MTAGALYEGADLFGNSLSILKGLPFCAALLLILGTHEFGHYIASRLHKVVSTLPYFIPAPPVPPMIGTFGAVIRMKTPITTKNALVDIGASGPLVGFVFAVIVMVIGIHFSTIAPVVHNGSVAFGEPIIERLLVYLMMGEIPHGYELVMHPVAFAGWIGFFVTALNLLPIGQLDGGHIMYAIFGPDHRKVSLGNVGHTRYDNRDTPPAGIRSARHDGPRTPVHLHGFYTGICIDFYSNAVLYYLDYEKVYRRRINPV